MEIGAIYLLFEVEGFFAVTHRKHNTRDSSPELFAAAANRGGVESCCCLSGRANG